MPRQTPSKRRQSMKEAEAQGLDAIKAAQAAKVGSSRMGELGLAQDKIRQKRRAAEIILKYGGGRKGTPRET